MGVHRARAYICHMASPLALYRDPIAMEPLFPSDPSGELEHLATELVRTSAKLSEAMHPVTRAAVAELVRPMNSYYSNLIEGHDTHPLDILTQMGAITEIANAHLTGGEPVGDLTIRFHELHSTDIGGTLVVRAIDEMPIWAVAASQSAGISTVRDASELRVKEVDRIAVLAGELRKMGVAITEQADGFSVKGPTRLHGATVDSHDDHRLGMSLAVAALLADSPTLIHQADCLADSFPGFVEVMQALGATMTWVE